MVYDVLCIGSATVDHFLNVDTSISKVKLGDKVLVKSSAVHTGGGATNSAAALSKMGLNVKMLTKLGNDHDAEFIKGEMTDYGVKNICEHASRKSTDFSTVVYSKKDRIIYVHKGASQDLLVTDCSKRDLNVKWVYLASLIGKSFKSGVVIARQAWYKKAKILFNPSQYLAKQGKKLNAILRLTTLLVLNKEEAKVLLGKNISTKEMLFELHDLGPEKVVITDGANKLYALDGKKVYSLMPRKTKIVSTAGCGDAFTSGLLAGLIQKRSFLQSLKIGLVNAESVLAKIGTKHDLLTLAAAERKAVNIHE